MSRPGLVTHRRPVVCHLSTAHPAFDTRIFRRECRSLVEAGYDVHLVLPHDREEVVDGVHIIPLPQPRGAFARRTLWPLLAARRAAATRAELYHFHDPELMPVMQALHHLTGTPVVWDAHEVYTETIPHFNQLGWRPASVAAGRLFDRYELLACRRSFAGVVTITDMMADRYQRAAIRTAVVGNYVEEELLEEATDTRPVRSQPPLVVTTGLLNRDRGIFLMVDAFAKLRARRPCRLAFWGWFPREEDRAQLERAVEERGLTGDVLIGGPYARDELLDQLLPTASVGCVLLLEASDFNALGVPNRLTEYWARRLPVVASRDTNVARMTLEVGAGLVTDNTPEGLADCLEQILADPATIQAMGERGRRAVRERYNWSSAFSNLLALYQALLPGARGNGTPERTG
ncbi:MAG TPA: glycosyltransferase [Gemmatimonadales bacterium]|nr:glycosyltransferase [Gemmatimonadales bacterium]